MLGIGLTGCAPTLRLSTPEPVKVHLEVDVNIRDTEGTVRRLGEVAETTDPVAKSRRDRLAEVQLLKDNRIVGENRRGFLEELTIPPAWAEREDYIKQVIESENADRQVLIASDARRRGSKVTEAEVEAARRFQAAAWPGEWIQISDGAWMQKEGGARQTR
jgi:uncharacterized protein YdbL (DUF1318 family)